MNNFALTEEVRDELFELTGHLVVDALTDQQKDRLAEIVEGSEEACELYCRYLNVHSTLSQYCGVRRPAAVGTSIVEQEIVSPKTVVTYSFLGNSFNRVGDFISKPTPLSVAMAFIIIASLLATLALVSTEDRKNAPVAESTKIEIKKNFIAKITELQNCKWKKGFVVRMQGESLRKGEVLHLKEGVMQITFRSGAIALLEGPARLRLQTENSAYMLFGKSTFYVPEPAVGFSVETFTAKIVDLGTKFGVQVDADGMSEVHVFEGKVEATPLYEDGSKGKKLRLVKNEAMRFYRRPLKDNPLFAAKLQSFISSIAGHWPKSKSPIREDLVVHLDADHVQLDSLNRVMSWTNLVNQQFNADMDGENRNPILVENALSQRSTVRFSSGVNPKNSDFLRIKDAPWLDPQETGLTIFVVASSSSEGDQFLLAKGQDLTPRKGYSLIYRSQKDQNTVIARASNGKSLGAQQISSNLSTPKIISMQLHQGNVQGTLNGSSENWKNGALKAKSNKFGSRILDTPNSLKIGCRSGDNTGEFFRGDIFEILIFNRELSTQEKEQLNQYLMEKYEL